MIQVPPRQLVDIRPWLGFVAEVIDHCSVGGPGRAEDLEAGETQPSILGLDQHAPDAECCRNHGCVDEQRCFVGRHPTMELEDRARRWIDAQPNSLRITQDVDDLYHAPDAAKGRVRWRGCCYKARWRSSPVAGKESGAVLLWPLRPKARAWSSPTRIWRRPRRPQQRCAREALRPRRSNAMSHASRTS